MSSQRGNTERTRPQKYKNHFAFKNTLHDTSHQTKKINSLQIANVCERCKSIIEWKIKYKKYKPLKAPGICNKCEQKTVKHAYHTMCGPCAKERNVCPKCGNERELVEAQPSKEEQIKLDAEMHRMLKTLPERKRRTFLRFVNQQNGNNKDKRKGKGKRKEKTDEENDGRSEDESDEDSNEESNDDKEDEEPVKCTQEQLKEMLKSLVLENDDIDDFDDSDDSDDSDLDDNSDTALPKCNTVLKK